MLVGVLLKQAAVALALSVLLYCYALIMGTSDSVLPWALKILMITLVTVAVFIYRKPFQHLFSAVGYGAIGSADRAEADLARAAATARANTATAATLAVPGSPPTGRPAGRGVTPPRQRAWRWRPRPAAAAGVAAGLQAGEAGSGAAVDGTVGDGTAVAPGTIASGAAGSGALGMEGTGRMSLAARARAAATSATSVAEPPPLNLPCPQRRASAPVRR